MDNLIDIVFAVFGLLAIAGAAFDWDWFMEHRRARRMTSLLGSRDRTRVVYAVVGLGFLTFSLLAWFGVIN